MRRWLRWLVVIGVVAFAVGGAGLAYEHAARPRTLRVAAGSLDGEAVRLMTALATQLAASNAAVRLKVVDTATMRDAAKALTDGTVELAVVRGDDGDLAAARAVVRLTHGVVMLVVPAGARVTDVAGLADKRIGVLGGDANRRLAALLAKEYGLERARFRDLDLAEARQALQARQIDALLAVLPLADRYLAMLRDTFAGSDKLKPVLLPIDAAGAIAALARQYESYELPKGALRGAPPVPDEDVTTLRVPVYLVADKRLDDDTAAALAKAIMEARGALVASTPLLAQIGAPNTEKDATLPVHPGAEAYFTGSLPSFFDKYGDWLFYGSLSLGFLTSAAAGARNFLRGEGRSAPSATLDALRALGDRARRATTAAERAAIEDALDDLLKDAVATDDAAGLDPVRLNLAILRIDRQLRRGVLDPPADLG